MNIGILIIGDEILSGKRKDGHFLPGFPQMAWPMMEWVLDTHYPEMRDLAPESEEIFTVLDISESYLLDLMNDFVARYPDVRFSSLPHLGVDGVRRIEFGLKGRHALVAEALGFLQGEIAQRGYKMQAGRVTE